MGSLAAKKVAKEVLETIGKGKRPSVLKIAPKHGYSPKTAGSGEIQQTKSYKSVIKPFLTRLERERERILAALEVKDLTEERYRDLVDGLDKITKNVQLLSGKSTENIQVIPIANAFVSDRNEHKEDRLFTEED